MSQKKISVLTSVLLLSTSIYSTVKANCGFEALLSTNNIDLPTIRVNSNYLDSIIETNEDYKMIPSVSVIDSQTESRSQRISAQRVIDFTNLSYIARALMEDHLSEELENSYQSFVESIENDGWQLGIFQGATGTANNQIESVGGIVAFKGKNVVLATRGTETMADWMTDFRAVPDLQRKLKAVATLGYGDSLVNIRDKASQATSNHLYGIEGKLAYGFFQSHLSSWDQIKESITDYAKSRGLKPGDLYYTVTGHSLGGAKAVLNAVNLLTDTDLQIGVTRLENSFLDMDFHGIGRKSDPENKGNVELVTFEAPRVLGVRAHKAAEGILDNDNVIRVENRGWIINDPVIHAGPAFLGFKHPGNIAPVNQGTFVTRHFMSNVGPQAVQAIEKAREGIDIKRKARLRQEGKEHLAQEKVTSFSHTPVQPKPNSFSWFKQGLHKVKAWFGY